MLWEFKALIGVAGTVRFEVPEMADHFPFLHHFNCCNNEHD